MQQIHETDNAYIELVESLMDIPIPSNAPLQTCRR